VSDSEGRVSFVGIPPGHYVLRAERLGYQLIEGTLEVGSGQEFVVLLNAMQTADAGEPVTIVGRVTDENGQAVTDAGIRVVGQSSSAISNQQGRFRLDQLGAGVFEVVFERLGYASRTAHFLVQAGRTAELSVVMPTEAIALEPISVTVLSGLLERSGFYRRLDRGFGEQFDRQDLERMNPERVYDVVRNVAGLSVSDPRRSGPGGTSYAVNRRWAGLTPPPGVRPPQLPPNHLCYLALYIDGARVGDPDLEQIRPGDIEAMEVYVGGTGPVEYQQNPCGAILIWTRR
jgi:hypothetical protein